MSLALGTRCVVPGASDISVCVCVRVCVCVCVCVRSVSSSMTHEVSAHLPPGQAVNIFFTRLRPPDGGVCLSGVLSADGADAGTKFSV